MRKNQFESESIISVEMGISSRRGDLKSWAGVGTGGVEKKGGRTGGIKEVGA